MKIGDYMQDLLRVRITPSSPAYLTDLHNKMPEYAANINLAQGCLYADVPEDRLRQLRLAMSQYQAMVELAAHHETF